MKTFPQDGIYQDQDTGLRFRFENGVPVECIDFMAHVEAGAKVQHIARIVTSESEEVKK